MIRTTQEAEIERINSRAKPTWELFQSFSLAEIVHKAIELGWADKKVQVRAGSLNGEPFYSIEPFEKDCGCSSILRYIDYAPERSSSEG